MRKVRLGVTRKDAAMRKRATWPRRTSARASSKSGKFAPIAGETRLSRPEGIVGAGGLTLGVYLVQPVPILGMVGAPVIAAVVVILYTLGVNAFCQWSESVRTEEEGTLRQGCWCGLTARIDREAHRRHSRAEAFWPATHCLRARGTWDVKERHERPARAPEEV